MTFNIRELLGAEVYAVADRLGVRHESFAAVEPALYYPATGRDEAALGRAIDALVERRRRDQKQRSGIWRNIVVRHRRSEIDNQLVPVLRHGELQELLDSRTNNAEIDCKARGTCLPLTGPALLSRLHLGPA